MTGFAGSIAKRYVGELMVRDRIKRFMTRCVLEISEQFEAVLAIAPEPAVVSLIR
ncbi:MAG: hypothetical protein ACK5DW_15055 [Burkholderiales bacterium]